MVTLRSHCHHTEEMGLASYFPKDTFMEGVLVGFTIQYHVSVVSLGGHILLGFVEPILISGIFLILLPIFLPRGFCRTSDTIWPYITVNLLSPVSMNTSVPVHLVPERVIVSNSFFENLRRPCFFLNYFVKI